MRPLRWKLHWSFVPHRSLLVPEATTLQRLLPIDLPVCLLQLIVQYHSTAVVVKQYYTWYVRGSWQRSDFGLPTLVINYYGLESAASDCDDIQLVLLHHYQWHAAAPDGMRSYRCDRRVRLATVWWTIDNCKHHNLPHMHTNPCAFERQLIQWRPVPLAH